jgi:anti-sigma factor RsiW
VNCARARDLLHPHADGELDVPASLDLERHLAHCPDCAGTNRRLRDLRSTLAAAPYFKAPPALARQVRAATAPAAPPPEQPARLRTLPFALAASLLLVTALSFVILRYASAPAGDALGRELAAAHVRSLMADHLLDVPSSDRHTVKPWFAGRLDFSPDVRDLAASGFPLVGGRLDYLAGRPVAALVYRRGQHVINCFVWPAPPGSPHPPPTTTSAQSYAIVHFTHAGLTAYAISDANPYALEQFAAAFRTPATATAP